MVIRKRKYVSMFSILFEMKYTHSKFHLFFDTSSRETFLELKRNLYDNKVFHFAKEDNLHKFINLIPYFKLESL